MFKQCAMWCIRRWDFWEVLEHEGGGLTSGISAVTRDVREFPSSFHYLRVQESVLGRWTLTHLSWHPELRLLASKTVRNTFLSLISHLSVVLWYFVIDKEMVCKHFPGNLIIIYTVLYNWSIFKCVYNN